MDLQSSRTLRDLYPTLSEQELKDAEANFANYLEIALRVYQEQLIAPEAVDTFDAAPMIKERSNYKH